MVALLLPLALDVIAIQLAFADAVQVQPASVETSTDNRPPLAPIESLARLSANRQGAPVWLSGT